MQRSPPLPLALLVLVAACQEPFGTDRHDLRGLRVAALAVDTTGPSPVGRVAVVVEGRPWSDDPVVLRWRWVADASASAVAELDPAGPSDAEGPAPVLPPTPADAEGLVLLAAHGEEVYRAVLPTPLPDSAPLDPGPIAARSLPWTVQAVSGEALAVEARRETAAGETVDHVPLGGFARLTVPAPDDAVIRWMHTAPGGTFLELDPTVTDWAAGEVVLDDDELEEAEAGPEGPRTLLALALSPTEDGANGWSTRDLFVGPPPPGLWTPSGRFLPAESAPPPGPILATLARDDASPTGLRLDDVAPAAPDDPDGTEALPCRDPVSGPFDPDWLLAQRCTRADVVGARVRVVPR
jgi:hypothetical protein